MKILGQDKVEAFKRKHPTSRKPLAKWDTLVAKAAWENFAKLKETFNTADYFDGKTVFNIGGNKYRLIAVVQYAVGVVIVTCSHP